MARRRRMHRQTRKLLLALSGLAACVVVAFFGVKWLFSQGANRTQLASEMRLSEVDGQEPALKPIVEAPLELAAKSNGEMVAKVAAAGNEAKTAQPSAPKAEPKADASYKPPVPPTTQPTKIVHLPANEAKKQFEAGMEANAKSDVLAARTHLNAALHGGLSAHDLQKTRETLAAIADQTIFVPHTAIRNDPLVHKYVVKTGDTLGRIARRQRISEDFLAGINKLTNKAVVRLGSSMKVVDGPFNAAVIKKDHLMHVYLQDVYVKSYPVALGIGGGTPTGLWKVANHLENPGWTDPRTGHRWHPDDPANPIGEFWIGLEGLEGECVGQQGFGIHGTIDEKTIGKDVSLGCVRLAADDIAFLYKLLVPGISMVTIAE